MSIQSFQAICDFCGNENHITVATVSILDRSRVDCAVCGGTLGQLPALSPAGKQEDHLASWPEQDPEEASF
jgi:hypothetical protein